MDKLIEKYKEELKRDDYCYPSPSGLRTKIIKDLDDNDFEIPVKIVNKMLKQARSEGKIVKK